MNTQILMPTDFSDNSLNAIRYALKLYAASECTFYLMHIYEINPFSMQNSAYIIPEEGHEPHAIAKENAEKKFEKFIKKVKSISENPKHEFKTIITYDLILKAVKEEVAKHDIDIIVLGTKGKTGSASVLFGTNALTLMEGVKECPVLAVPEDLDMEPPKEIVFPTDYKDPFKQRELVYLIDIALAHKAHISILHVKESKQLNQQQLDGKALLVSILSEVDHSFHELEDVGVQAGINTFIEVRKSDMIAFINHKHSFFSNLFSKPLVKKLGYYSKVPVLVLNDSH